MAWSTARTNGRALALAALIAAHLAAAVLAVRAVVGLLGLQELPVVLPPVVGLLWGQAILLGQFVVLGTKHALLRLLLVASWYGAVIYLAQPFFRATGGHDSLVAACVVLAMPFVLSALLAAVRIGGGLRITRYDPQSTYDDGKALRFSLRHVFVLISLAAIVLAGLRFAHDRVGMEQALLFGLLPATEVFVLLPLLSLWAAIGGKHPTSRSLALILVGLASVLGPLFVGRATLKVYWMLVCPAVMPSAVVIGSLLIVRAIGYRYDRLGG